MVTCWARDKTPRSVTRWARGRKTLEERSLRDESSGHVTARDGYM